MSGRIGNVTISLDAHALSAYDDDGFLTGQHDAFGEESAGADAYEFFHPHGVISRPLDPQVDAQGQPDSSHAATIFRMHEGGRNHGLWLNDPHATDFLPLNEPGATTLYGTAWGQFVKLDAQGRIFLATTTQPASAGTAAGQPITLTIDPNDGLEFVSPWMRVVVGPTGFHVKHLQAQARLDLTAVGGLPPPLDAIKSGFSVEAGIVRMDSSAIALGSKTAPTGGPAANATPLLEWMTAVQAALVSIQAALATATPQSGITPAQTGVVEAAVTACDVLFATMPELLPSLAVGV